jgi:hypothetical protein
VIEATVKAIEIANIERRLSELEERQNRYAK